MITQKDKQPAVNQKLPEIKNAEYHDTMVKFDGAWLPSVDPALIGPNNFQTLINMRYKKDGSGIEGVNGYYDFNANAITNYTTINTGLHFTTQGTDSYIIVHASDDSDNGRLYYSTSTIGGSEGAGSFETTQIFDDTTTGLNPRLAKGPSDIVAYCNQLETKTWSGVEAPPGSVFAIGNSSTSTDPGYFIDGDSQGWAFPIDVTERMLNTFEGETPYRSYMTFSTADNNGILILSTKRLQGIKIYIVSGYENSNSANTNTIDVETWNGTTFTNVSNLSDGTSKMTQTGTLSFDSTVDTSAPYHYEGRYLFAYLIEMTASSGTSSCRISQITVDAPVQDITNVWDGIYRQPIQVQRYNNTDGTYEDFTLHVSESSTVGTPVGLYLGQITSSDHFIIMFEEQISAIQFTMLGSLVNTADAQLAASGGIQYWDGDSFTNLTFSDDTLDNAGDSSFGQTGLISWAELSPDTQEYKTTLFGTTGYAYKFTLDATVSGSAADDVTIDIITGIPATKHMQVYKFPALYKNKLMLCGYIEGNEGNRIDFSADSAPDVFNGEDSSMDGFQSIYVGSNEEVICATQLYNRFGSNIFSTFVILKDNEVWMLTGDSPLDYRLYPISLNIGCPAPYTLTTAEVGFEIGESVERNVAMWVSHQGPVMFDGAILHPLNGIEVYFDPNEDISVNFTYLDQSQAWFDSTYQEWNLLLATGESTTLNTWLVYNIKLRKWFRKDVGTYVNILTGISATSSSGNKYVYGGGDDGKLYQLESGTSWDGNPIQYSVTTGDFFPSNNQWDITLLRRFKFVCKRVDEEGALVNLYTQLDSDLGPTSGFSFFDISELDADSGTQGFYFYDVFAQDATSGTDGFRWVSGVSFADVDINDGYNRLIIYTTPMNQIAWSHAITFEFSSNESHKGFEPIMWGYQWAIVRKDV